MKKLLIILLFGLTGSMMNKTMAQHTPAVLNHIAVYVGDLKRSTGFYGSLFNLEVIPEPFKDGKHTWFSLGNRSALHLIEGAKAGQVYDRNDHLCFSVTSIEDFINKLKAQKISYGDWGGKTDAINVRVDGVKQIYFQDPDGHWLEVNNAR